MEVMMLRAQIYEDVKQAMKARDAKRLEVVRYLWSEIKNVEIDAKHELVDEEVVTLLRREVKRRNDSIEQFKQGGRQDLVDQETKNVEVIETYLPQLMSREQIGKVVDRIAASGVGEFGVVMGKVMAEMKGKADGKLVSEVVREKVG
jgi:hypothetical protein